MRNDILAIEFLDALRPKLQKLDIEIISARWLADSLDNPRSLEVVIDDYLTGEQTRVWITQWSVEQWFNTPVCQSDRALDLIIDEIDFELNGEDAIYDFSCPYDQLAYLVNEPLTYKLCELPIDWANTTITC